MKTVDVTENMIKQKKQIKTLLHVRGNSWVFTSILLIIGTQINYTYNTSVFTMTDYVLTSFYLQLNNLWIGKFSQFY